MAMGATHNEHHYIPKFLLKEWECQADEKLSAMRWIRGEITEKRYKAKSVAKERHLYAMRKADPEPNQQLEIEFMTKHVDDPAALVHRTLLANGLADMTDDKAYTWTRFLVALVYRGPGAVSYVRAKGIEALCSQFDAHPDDYLEFRGDEPEETLRKYVEKNDAQMLGDFGTYALPNLIQTSFLNKKIYEARWMTRKISRGISRLVIGDRPLTLFGAIADDFLLYLPIAPDMAFLAFTSPNTAKCIRSRAESTFLRELNRGMVEQASVYVWGQDMDHRKLLEKRLAKTPAGPGLGFGPRPPA